MNKSIWYWWHFLLTIQQVLQYGYAHLLVNDSEQPLGIDKAFLIIRNNNYSDSLTVMYNYVICEKCDFDRLCDPIAAGSNQTVIVNTAYAYDFQIWTNPNMTNPQCEIKAYQFREHGSYQFEVVNTSNIEDICSITQIKESSYYWLPLIIGMSIILTFVLLIQLWHRISKHQRLLRFLPISIQQELINNDDNNSQTNVLTTIGDDVNYDIIRTLNASNELPLFGSTRSNNTIRITKLLPKRLHSLDTFRGLSLMIMILVNYGGK